MKKLLRAVLGLAVLGLTWWWLLRHADLGSLIGRMAELPAWVWALAGAGLTPESTKGRRVLVHGASGALGQLALRLLSQWGAELTAICRETDAATCQELGAHQVIDRTKVQWRQEASSFDATLNFASWDDEAWLLQRLRPGALGHATTVHPLLGHIDRLGWWRGAWQVWPEPRGR